MCVAYGVMMYETDDFKTIDGIKSRTTRHQVLTLSSHFLSGSTYMTHTTHDSTHDVHTIGGSYLPFHEGAGQNNS